MAKQSKDEQPDDASRTEIEETGEQEEQGVTDGPEDGALEDTQEEARPKKRVEAKSKGKSGAKKNGQVQEEKERKPASTPTSRRRLVVILSLAAILVLVASATAGYFLLGKKSSTTPSGQKNTNSVGQLVPRRIDGVLDEPEHQNLLPVAIMVENHTASRPQSGLNKANIVYEALAEGGITRFLAIYALTDTVAEIGPVRSARPYYVDWARGYDAMYVHIGGSPKAYSRISSTGAFDLDQFANSRYFWRDKSRDVASEHTLYTSSRLMTLALIDKKADASGNYEPWKYKKDADAGDRPASEHLTINFSTFSYKVDYEYDPVKNEYVRSVAEQPHVMRDGTQLRPKNVAVLSVKRQLEQPADGKGRLAMDTVGQGVARYFYDGQEHTGTWKKQSPQDPLEFLLDDGSTVQLNAGQTWVEIVPPEQEVTVR